LLLLNSSYLSVFLHEALNRLHVQAVVHVGVPLQSGREQVFVSKSGFPGVLLKLLVGMRQSGELAAFPREVADVEGVMEGAEEHQSVENDGVLVGVPPHYGVLSLNHYLINYY